VDLQERVRQLAAAGGDLSAVRSGLDRALRLSLAYDLAAISTVDPPGHAASRHRIPLPAWSGRPG